MRIVKRMMKQKRNNQSERRRINNNGSRKDPRANIEESKTKCRMEEMSCI